MRRLSDTSPEAQRVLSAAYRAMDSGRKLRLIEQQLRLARSLHEAGVRHRNPDATRSEIRDSWNAITPWPDLWKSIKRDVRTDQELEPLSVLRQVVAVFEKFGLAYAIRGSWASSFHGEPRTTHDADVSVEPFPGKEQSFAASFGSDYYLSIGAIKQANRERFTFNIIHTPSAFKVDVFVMKNEGFDLSMMARRSVGTEAGGSEPALFWVSAEDIVLLKLRWYRLGNEVSDRQWSDVLGVLRTRSGLLEEAYLNHWAAELRVADLLARAREEADESR
jgi:hypothetical protein